MHRNVINVECSLTVDMNQILDVERRKEERDRKARRKGWGVCRKGRDMARKGRDMDRKGRERPIIVIFVQHGK